MGVLVGKLCKRQLGYVSFLETGSLFLWFLVFGLGWFVFFCLVKCPQSFDPSPVLAVMFILRILLPFHAAGAIAAMLNEVPA